MSNIDDFELEISTAYDAGKLKSVATKAELAKFKAAARAIATKDRRVNIRLSSGDLNDIQVKALEEGMPYQTLIASVLHKYVTGRLTEQPEHVVEPSRSRLPKTAPCLYELMGRSAVPIIASTARVRALRPCTTRPRGTRQRVRPLRRACRHRTRKSR